MLIQVASIVLIMFRRKDFLRILVCVLHTLLQHTLKPYTDAPVGQFETLSTNCCFFKLRFMELIYTLIYKVSDALWRQSVLSVGPDVMCDVMSY